MDPVALLRKYFAANPQARDIVLEHSRMVATKALDIASSLPVAVNMIFIEQAALLHDIGVCRTNAPFIACSGPLPYMCHGIAGREILEEEVSRTMPWFVNVISASGCRKKTSAGRICRYLVGTCFQ